MLLLPAISMMQALLCGPIMVIVGIVFLASATKDTRTADINTYNSAVSGELHCHAMLRSHFAFLAHHCSGLAISPDLHPIIPGCCPPSLQAGRRAAATRTTSASATTAPSSSTLQAPF